MLLNQPMLNVWKYKVRINWKRNKGCPRILLFNYITALLSNRKQKYIYTRLLKLFNLDVSSYFLLNAINCLIFLSLVFVLLHFSVPQWAVFFEISLRLRQEIRSHFFLVSPRNIVLVTCPNTKMNMGIICMVRIHIPKWAKEWDNCKFQFHHPSLS